MNIEIKVSEDVPRDEVWIVQPTGRQLHQKITPSGDLLLTVIERAKILSKIVGLK